MATPKTTAAVIAVAALVLASVAAYLVYNYLSVKEQEALKAKMEVQPIVVAVVEIPYGSNLQAAQMKTTEWPKNSLPAGWKADPKALEGRMAITTIQAGTPVLESSLAPTTAEGGMLSYIIPTGHRAVTVAVNEVVGVAGFVLPNSIVDVVATVTPPKGGERLSKIVLQNVKVLAIGQIMQQKEGKPVVVPTVTLDVTPGDAEKLIIASENRVQLILKHLGDSEDVSTRGATVGTLLGSSMPPVATAAGKPSHRRGAARPAAAGASEKAEPSMYIIEVIKGGSRTKEQFRQEETK